jgi:hypothetical protein
MSHLCFSERLAIFAAIGLAIGMVKTGVPAAFGAIQDQSEQVVAEVFQPPARPMPGANNVMMRFEEDGDLFDGHIRVVLSPETRPLTLMQARSAAQEAFLETLNEPALADVIDRITIIVELVPEAYESDLKQVFLYESKDGKNWSLTAAD